MKYKLTLTINKSLEVGVDILKEDGKAISKIDIKLQSDKGTNIKFQGPLFTNLTTANCDGACVMIGAEGNEEVELLVRSLEYILRSIKTEEEALKRK